MHIQSNPLKHPLPDEQESGCFSAGNGQGKMLHPICRGDPHLFPVIAPQGRKTLVPPHRGLREAVGVGSLRDFPLIRTALTLKQPPPHRRGSALAFSRGGDSPGGGNVAKGDKRGALGGRAERGRMRNCDGYRYGMQPSKRNNASIQRKLPEKGSFRHSSPGPSGHPPPGGGHNTQPSKRNNASIQRKLPEKGTAAMAGSVEFGGDPSKNRNNYGNLKKY